MKKISLEKSACIIFSVLIICFAFVSLAFAWNSPTADAPGNNVPPPLNTGSTAQGKSGDLVVGTSDLSSLTLPTGKSLMITDTSHNPEIDLQYGTGDNHWAIYNSQTNDDLRIWGNSDNRLTILQSGNIGIGTISPTAVLQLKAGTATAGTAPLKFTAGTLLTTTEPGAIEYNNGHLYFTSSDNNNTRYQLDRQSTSLTFSKSLVNTSNTVTLVGDSATPGNSYYYGTDSGGNKGFYSLAGMGGGAYWAPATATANIGDIYNTNMPNRVGIGTATPEKDSVLTVYGTSGPVGRGLMGDVRATVQNSNSAGGASYLMEVDDGTGNGTYNGYAITAYGPKQGNIPNTLTLRNGFGSIMFLTGLGNGNIVNTERMTIDSSGKVGIGTTSPASLLQLKTSDWAKINLETTNTTALARMGSDSNGLNFTTNALYNGNWSRDITSQSSFAYIQHLGDNAMEFRVAPPATGNITWNTAMVIKNTGYVGIGATSPAGILDVEGGNAASGNGTPIKLYAQNGNGSSNGGSIILMPGTSTDLGKYGLVQVGSSTGTAAPPYTNLNGLRISGGDTYNTIWQNQGALGINTAGGNLSLGIKNGVLGEALTILGTNGYVGIGTAAPGYNLEVAGVTKTAGGLIIQTVGSQSTEDSMTKATGQLWLRTDINP